MIRSRIVAHGLYMTLDYNSNNTAVPVRFPPTSFDRLGSLYCSLVTSSRLEYSVRYSSSLLNIQLHLLLRTITHPPRQLFLPSQRPPRLTINVPKTAISPSSQISGAEPVSFIVLRYIDQAKFIPARRLIYRSANRIRSFPRNRSYCGSVESQSLLRGDCSYEEIAGGLQLVNSDHKSHNYYDLITIYYSVLLRSFAIILNDSRANCELHVSYAVTSCVV